MPGKLSPHYWPCPFCSCGSLFLCFWLFSSAIVWAIVCQDVWFWKSCITPLSKWHHIFSLNPAFIGLWKLVTKLVLVFLDIGFVWLLVLSKGYVCSTYQQILQLSIYLNPFKNKKQIHFKKNQALFFIWLSFLGFRFSTTGRIVPERKII